MADRHAALHFGPSPTPAGGDSPGALPAATGAAVASALARAGCEARLDGPEHAAIFRDGIRVTRVELHEIVPQPKLRAILRTFGVSPGQLHELLRAQAAARSLPGPPDGSPPATLGDILFADGTPWPPESEWTALVESMAALDRSALHALRRRTRGIVYALLLRLTCDRQTADELTYEVFEDVWRRAHEYDKTSGSVVGWVMNLARALAAERLADEAARAAAGKDDWSEPAWKEASPGLWYQLLAADASTHVVSMLVRLEPGTSYPAHLHAGREELHLLEGELWIDDRKLHPGDYNRAEAGTGDDRVWSETGCACVLVTSYRDALK